MSLDRLSVSLAFAPDERVPVGTLSQSGRDSLFQFDESFLAAPLPLSPLRLPVRPGVQAYDGRGGWQTLSVAGEGANPGPDDLLRLAAQVDIPRADALDALERSRAARAALPSLCRDLGVRPPRL